MKRTLRKLRGFCSSPAAAGGGGVLLVNAVHGNHMSDMSPYPDFWQVNDPKRPSGGRRDATLEANRVGASRRLKPHVAAFPEGKEAQREPPPKQKRRPAPRARQRSTGGKSAVPFRRRIQVAHHKSHGTPVEATSTRGRRLRCGGRRRWLWHASRDNG